MNQYIKEGFFTALEKHGMSTVASEMANSTRHGELNKEAQAGHSFDSRFNLAMLKLAGKFKLPISMKGIRNAADKLKSTFGGALQKTRTAPKKSIISRSNPDPVLTRRLANK